MYVRCVVQRALNVELASIKDTTRGNPTAGHMRMAFWRDFVAAYVLRATRTQLLQVTFPSLCDSRNY